MLPFRELCHAATRRRLVAGARTPLGHLPGMPEPSSEQWQASWGQCRQSPKELVSVALASSAASLSGEGAPALSGSESTYGLCGRGQLTRLGESQLEQLGAFIRVEYLENDAGWPLLTGYDDEGLKVASTRPS